MRVALKVDVTNRVGLARGLPALLDLFHCYDVKASIFFSPDVFVKPGGFFGWFNKKNLAQQKHIISEVRESGHEIGLSPARTRQWLSAASGAGSKWTESLVAQSIADFRKIFSIEPSMFAATGWQTNSHLLQLEERLNFDFASDTRGKYPYYPELLEVRSCCPQIPTTLPTLREILQMPDVTEHNIHEYIYAESRYLLPAGHVYSASAEVEGINYLAVMEKLLVMWRGQEGAVRSLGAMFRELDLDSLPVHRIGWDCPNGTREYLATQSVSL